MGGQIKPAELQELPMVPKAAEVAGLGQNGGRGDRSNAWDPTQELVVRALVQELDGHRLKGVALLNEAACLGDDEAEQANRRGVDRDRQTDRGAGRLVDISEQALFRHLAPNHVPGGCDERLLAQGRNAAGCRKAVEEGKEPSAAAVMAKAGDLGEVEGQVVGQDAVEHLGFGLRDRLMGLRDLLDVVKAGRKRVMVGLRGLDPEHVQGDLRVLGVVLVPAVVERLARASERQGGDQPDREAGLQKAPGEGTMVIAGGLEAAGDRLAEAGQEVDKAVVLSPGIEHGQAPPTSVAWDLDQDLVTGLADIDRDENALSGRKLGLGHGESLSGMRLGTPSL